MIEVDAQLVTGKRNRCSFDLYVDREFFHLMILYTDDQIVLKPSTRIIEHRHHYFLGLPLMKYAHIGLAHNTDPFIIGEIYFLCLV